MGATLIERAKSLCLDLVNFSFISLKTSLHDRRPRDSQEMGGFLFPELAPSISAGFNSPSPKQLRIETRFRTVATFTVNYSDDLPLV